MTTEQQECCLIGIGDDLREIMAHLDNIDDSLRKLEDQPGAQEARRHVAGVVNRIREMAAPITPAIKQVWREWYEDDWAVPLLTRKETSHE